MKKKQVNVNGKRVTYYESRDNGKTVVFVHGFSSCSSIFIRQLIDSVLSYQFRIIAVDLLGHGNADFSDTPEKDYTINGQTDFLCEFCKHLEIKDAVFAGHNIGGNIIIQAIEKLNNIKGLVLLSSIPFSNPFNEDLFKDKNKLELLFKSGIDDSDIHKIAGWMVEENTSYPEFLPEIMRKSDIHTRKFFYSSILNNDYKDQTEIVNQTNIPIAIYHGMYDQIFKSEILKSLHIKNLWNNKIQEITDGGHIFFYENPADFNVNLESFLNSVF